MKKINSEELIKIYGGFSITGSMLSSIVKGVNAMLELGRSLGSAIRRGFEKSLCSL